MISQKGWTLLPLTILLGIIGVVIFTTSIKSQITLKPSPSPQTLVTPQTQNSNKNEAVQQERLEKYLIAQAAILGVSDNISLYFKDLDHGKEISIDPTRSWIPASTIKTYVVLEVFRQRSLGLIDFNQTITIKPENVVPTELETDEFPRLREGTQATIKQLVEAMIIQSDNTAYNTLLDILDRRNINLSLKNIGITETIVGEKLNLDETQFQEDLKIPGRQPNTTTVKDLATYFDLLYNKKIANADEILEIFKRQKINDMIPAFLPHNTVVAHKTGDWAPIYNDGGVIFKPSDPFILTVFTNTDDPKIIAQLAKVAYFQNAQSVSKLTSIDTPKPLASQNHTRIYLAKSLTESDVLAAETPEKFPEISASDLGITQKDLNVSAQQAKQLFGALITPGSLLYKVKDFVQNIPLKIAKDNSSKVKAYLGLSKAHLSEAKSLIGAGDFKTADMVLKDSENDLEQATNLAKKDPNKELLLVEIKQVNDLHFAVFSERAEHLADNQKEQFIDDVYNFYKQNHEKVTPTINASVIASPTQQKPAVGTITEVVGDKAKIQFDDGSTKQIILTPDTKVRNFQEESYQNINNIRIGDKVAIVGLSNSKSEIIPQFILKNIPKELPQQHQGTVIEIKPDENIIKILDKKGQEENIKIDLNTDIRSKDTNVSLEGIKAGSQITVFGTTENSLLQKLGSNPQSSTSPNSAKTPLTDTSTSPVSSLSPSIKNTSQSSSNTSSNNTTQGRNAIINVQATSVTITKNSSGKQEKVETSQPQPKKAPEPPKPAQPTKPQSTKQENKPSNKK